jgi:hypothetical protein
MMDLESGERGDGISRQVEVGGIIFNADAAVTDGFACGQGGAGTGEAIEDYSFAEWEHGAGELAEKLLRFEAWMAGNGAFIFVGGRRVDDVTEGAVLGDSAQAAGLPFSEVVLNASFDGFSEEEPGLPHGTGHDADVGEFIVGVFGAVTAAHGHDETNDFPSSFESGSHEGVGDEIRKERIGCDANVSAWHEDGEKKACPGVEERDQSLKVGVAENGEPGEGGSAATVEGWGDSPDPSAAGAQLCLLDFRIFDQAIGRVGQDGVNAFGGLFLEPFKSVCLI